MQSERIAQQEEDELHILLFIKQLEAGIRREISIIVVPARHTGNVRRRRTIELNSIRSTVQWTALSGRCNVWMMVLDARRRLNVLIWDKANESVLLPCWAQAGREESEADVP